MSTRVWQAVPCPPHLADDVREGQHHLFARSVEEALPAVEILEREHMYRFATLVLGSLPPFFGHAQCFELGESADDFLFAVRRS